MRKKQKKWTALLMLLLAAFLAIPCIQPVQAATPRLNKTKVTLAKGAQIKLKVSGTKAKVKWSSDKRKVATVTSKGVVTARSKGVARITAKIGKKKLVCRVAVETPKLNKSRLTVNVGKAASLKVTGTKGKVRWYTTDASVATVTQKGVVRGVRAGSCRVYAKVNGGTFLCAVTVTMPPFDPDLAKRSIQYVTHKIDDGIIAIVKNNYIYAVELNMNCAYYNSSGEKVGEGSDNLHMLEPKKEVALLLKRPFSWDYGYMDFSRYEIDFSLEKSTDIGNAGKIACSASRSGDNLLVSVKNNGRAVERTVVAAVYFKDGKIIGYDKHIVDVWYSGASTRVNFEFPFGSDAQRIIPDKYKLYVNESYAHPEIPQG